MRNVLDLTDPHRAPTRQPAFNIPGIVAALSGALILIHLVRQYVLDELADVEVLALFAFVPARYDPMTHIDWPGGLGAEIWTFVTYAFLHASWMHLIVNLIWMLAFATPVARRFGTGRFMAFFAITAVAGAVAHLVTHQDAVAPMIGASASISGLMAAAVRFAFAPGGSLSGVRGPYADHMPAQSLSEAFRDTRVLGFVGIWVAVNVLFGVGLPMPGAEGGDVAWQAHMGGFFAGLLLFAFFDPVPRNRHRGGAAA
ncbi:rhomboid family intramembrane serine protease [Xanthobacteraceae bacterium A53D]